EAMRRSYVMRALVDGGFELVPMRRGDDWRGDVLGTEMNWPINAHHRDAIGAATLCADLAERIDKLTGPGSNHVRSLLRRLIVAVELRQQDDRRLGAEVWRASEQPDVPQLESPRRVLTFALVRPHAAAAD